MNTIFVVVVGICLVLILTSLVLAHYQLRSILLNLYGLQQHFCAHEEDFVQRMLVQIRTLQGQFAKIRTVVY